MFGKTKRQIEDLSRRVRSLEIDNRTLKWDILNLRKDRELDRRVLYCHDCQRYPATDELTTAFCKVCEDSCFRLKLKVESDVPKKTCLDDMDLFKK